MFQPLRLGAIAAIALRQLGIAATGNYGFFNALTIVLCVPLLDDTALARLRLGRAAGEPETESRARRAVVRVAVPLLLALSGLTLVRELAYTRWPRWGNEVLGLVAPRVVRVHVDASIRLAGHTDRIDPERWRPLIMNFCQFFGLGSMLHPSTLAEIPESAYRPHRRGSDEDSARENAA